MVHNLRFFITVLSASSLLISACQQKRLNSKLQGSPDSEFGLASVAEDQDSEETVRLVRKKAAQITKRGAISEGSLLDLLNNYGYSPAMNRFLAYADMLHWQDPSIVSVVRHTIGRPKFVGSPVTQRPLYCGKWDYRIISNYPIAVTKKSKGVTIVSDSTDKNTHIKWNSSNDISRSQIIFAIKNSDPRPLSDCQEHVLNPAPYRSPRCSYELDSLRCPNYQNPWDQGYNGFVDDEFYLFPPPQCAASRPTLDVRIKGTIVDCNNSGIVHSFDYSLNPVLNNEYGYSQHIKFPKIPGHMVSGRGVNFNQGDWAGSFPEDIIPDSQNACNDFENQLVQRSEQAQHCTSDYECIRTVVNASCAIIQNYMDFNYILHVLENERNAKAQGCSNPLATVCRPLDFENELRCFENRCMDLVPY